MRRYPAHRAASVHRSRAGGTTTARERQEAERSRDNLISDRQRRPPDYVTAAEPQTQVGRPSNPVKKCPVLRMRTDRGRRRSADPRPGACSSRPDCQLAALESTPPAVRALSSSTVTRRGAPLPTQGERKTAKGARAQRRRPPTRADDPTARRLGVAAVDADANRRPARGAVANPTSPQGQARR